MAQIKVYYAPGSCSRATLIALEEIGRPYEAEVVGFMKLEHRSPQYLALNPKGKVPLLVVDGKPLTETVAIFTWLAEAYPEAGLLPRPEDPFERAKVLADLAWAPSALHGLIARLRFPMMFTDRSEAYASVRDLAAAALADNFRLIEARLAERGWWHGDWSLQDAYLYWVWTRAADAGFDASAFPAYAAHKARMDERPATGRALQREAEGEQLLAARGATLVVPGDLVGQASRS